MLFTTRDTFARHLPHAATPQLGGNLWYWKLQGGTVIIIIRLLQSSLVGSPFVVLPCCHRLWNYDVMDRQECVRVYIRPHRSSMYADAAYCYRQSRSVCLSVCRSVATVSLAKTVELIVMPFGMLTRVSQKNHVLDGVQIPPCVGSISQANWHAYTCPAVDTLKATQ